MECEWQELQVAKDHDIVSFSYTQSEVLANLWEDTLYQFFNQHGIDYRTEQDLQMAGSSTKADCLILDQLIIQGRPVRWIDMKNTYCLGLL